MHRWGGWNGKKGAEQRKSTKENMQISRAWSIKLPKFVGHNFHIIPSFTVLRSMQGQGKLLGEMGRTRRHAAGEEREKAKAAV